MKHREMTWAAGISLAILVGGIGFAPAALAEFIVDVTQQGSNVVASGSGTIDLTDLTFAYGSGNDLSQIGANIGVLDQNPFRLTISSVAQVRSTLSG
jgi:hypothetical protein